MSAKRAGKPGFALGEFAAEAEALLIEGGFVYAWCKDVLPPSWRRISSLTALESSDLAPLVLHRRDEGESCNYDAARAKAVWELSSMLPQSAATQIGAVLEFAVQAERYRAGRDNTQRQLASRVHARGDCLRETVGQIPLLIMERDVYYPDVSPDFGLFRQNASPDVIMDISDRTQSLARLRKQYWSRLLAETANAYIDNEDLESAMAAIKAAVAKNESFLGMPVVYDAESTALKVLLGPAGRVVFAISSDAYVVEDADGKYYKFDPFVVTLSAIWETRKCTRPILAHPLNYKHWLYQFAAGEPLHLCDFVDSMEGDPYRISNALNLLLGARHTLRASLFQRCSNDEPRLNTPRFRSQRISRQKAQESGLPIYPYRRHGRVPESLFDMIRRPLARDVQVIRRRGERPR